MTNSKGSHNCLKIDEECSEKNSDVTRYGKEIHASVRNTVEISFIQINADHYQLVDFGLLKSEHLSDDLRYHRSAISIEELHALYLTSGQTSDRFWVCCFLKESFTWALWFPLSLTARWRTAECSSKQHFTGVLKVSAALLLERLCDVTYII